ncbi:hypothetical protein HF313_14390 [Massilia atriviolacea]|uniref:DUF3300 domain-containing protein n=1 Tax=Massilia atriviolacea TaxID=2495579 RepID=A0A430HQV6_9BURK|nr:hypothetical protein [Massilia atriviolacea]RSZ59911.1 hypothetical protein EJB06_06925 [Massilia atriviolacea]
MKHMIVAIALLGASLSGQAQTNVSIDIGQPGFYGRIELGDFGRPPVVYNQPILVERYARAAPEPVYLRVPPGHMKKWSKHCARYDACGRQVYFVRDDWYTNTYAPRYREMRGGRDRHHDHERGRDRHDRHDRHDRYERDDRGVDRGHGNGNGNGHGNGNGRDRETQGFR